MDTVAINKAHYPVTVLGYGRRIGIWLQGCGIRCKGCVSQDTWERDAGSLVRVHDLVDWCREVAHGELDGVTISGGEPFEQPEALRRLLDELRALTSRLPQPVDVLCYTGLPYRVIRRRHGTILSLLDAIVPEPFVERLPLRPLRGSANQPVIPLTPLGVARYGAIDAAGTAQATRFQLALDNQSIWFIGIPQRGDMTRMAEQCEAQGLVFNTVSWRA